MDCELIRIEPSSENSRLATLIGDGLSLPENDMAAISLADVESVYIDVARQSCQVRLRLWDSLSQEASDAICDALRNRLQPCTLVELDLDVQSRPSDFDEWLRANWSGIVDDIKAAMPTVNGWLTSARPSYDGNQLVIEVDGAVGVSHLRAKGVDAAVSDLIRRRAGYLVSVKLVEGDFAQQAEEMEREQEAERLRYLEALLAAQEPSSLGSEPRRNGKAKSIDADEDGVLYGKRISASPVRIQDIVTEEPKLTVAGQVFNIESRELKNGKILTSFCITDGTDSIEVKVFDEKGGTFSTALSDGDYALVEGSVRYDAFSRELTIVARNVNKAEAPELRDDYAEKRVELHLHTKMSAMDSVVDCTEAVKMAARWGHKAIAITDHGVVQAFPEAAKAAGKLGIKVIFGVEGYLIDDSSDLCSLPDASAGSGPDGSWGEVRGSRQRHLADDSWAGPGRSGLGADPGRSGSAGESGRSGPTGQADSSDEHGTFHIIILVKNRVGLKNLYKLVSFAHIQHFYRKPRIPRSLLTELREGLIIGSACEAGELYRAILRGESEDRLLSIASFYDYLEVQPLGNNDFLIRSGAVRSVSDLIAINRKILDIGRRLGKPVVATGDVHFLRPQDSIYRAILMAGQKYADADYQAPLYLRTTSEMLSEFEYLGPDDRRYVVIDAPNQVADMVEAGLKPLPSGLHPPKIEGADEEIRSLTWNTAKSIYGDPLPDIVQTRLETELDAIISNGFAVNYLIAHKLIAKSLEDGYIVGSRGSVGSSLVATMCKISEVNPLPPHYVCPGCRYSEFVTDGSAPTGIDMPDKDCPRCGRRLRKDGVDIPFETFLGFKGNSKVPDIDLNFADVYLPTIHKYPEELFGAEYVYKVGTVGTIADRTAYGFVKAYMDERGKVVRNAEIARLARGLTGVKRSTGQHPGGILVVPKEYEIYDFCPVQYAADDRTSGVITSHFNYHDSGIDECLTKLDLLGKGDPTTLRMLQDLTGLRVEDIPLDDPDTLAIFSGLGPLGISPEDIGTTIGSLGLPEFKTSFLRQVLDTTKPRTFDGLIKIMGLTHGTNVWLGNADELLKTGIAKSLDEVICCRDDIMLMLISKGMEEKLAYTIMEKVRKGKPLSESDVEAMKQVGVPDWYLESCKKIAYLFPKAHAAAYAMMAVRLGYFKVHYPVEFYAAYFSTQCDDFDVSAMVGGVEAVRARLREIVDKGDDASSSEESLAGKLELVLEAQLRGVRFLPVDLYRSDSVKFAIEDGALRLPFRTIPGLGVGAAESIVSARAERPFSSIEDLRKRTKLSKTLTDLMRQMGSLADLPESDQLSLFDMAL